MKSVAGDPLYSSMEQLKTPLALAGSGLPKWLPKAARVRLRAGDQAQISFWLSLCSLYRVVEFSAKVKLHTITKPGRDFNIIPYLDFVPQFFSLLIGIGAWDGVSRPKTE